IVMSFFAIPKLRPRRWISLGQKGVKRDWSLYFNTLFWNLNYWDSVSTMAGEVENPKKNFPLAMFYAVILTSLGYIIPLIAGTGAVELDQSEWQAGFLSTVAQMITGDWLKVWIDLGAVLSSIGLFEAQLSSSGYQLQGMAELAFLPTFFGWRAKWFNTPWVGIVVSTAIALGMSYMSYTTIVSSANFVYSLGMILEFASFLWLRWKLPQKNRPYKVPFRLPLLCVMCAVPVGFLIFIMTLATRMVYLVSGVMTAAGILWYLLMKLLRSKKWL
ncbi:hypothetical protein M569_12499, partial [Genlisea aurea]